MIFVYYEDGHCDDGDHGFVEMVDIEAAISFIESRLADDPKRNLEMYKLIEGNLKELEPVTTITRLVVKS